MTSSPIRCCWTASPKQRRPAAGCTFPGSLSDGGVHSHNTHLYGLLELAKKEGLKEVFIHCLLDGRDTPPQSGAAYLQELEAEIARIGIGRIATVMGRYYAMDRDNRWDRVEKAYNAIVRGEGECHGSAAEAIRQSYAAAVHDEFVIPCVICTDGNPVGPLRDGDGFIFFNFRSDRAREITRALALDDCSGFPRRHRPQLASYVCMTEYDATFGLPIAFSQEELTQHSRRYSGKGRQDATAHRRNGEVRPCHLLFQRRRGRAVSRWRSAA